METTNFRYLPGALRVHSLRCLRELFPALHISHLGQGFLFSAHLDLRHVCHTPCWSQLGVMTRTARRGKKKDPLPATPWEELSGGQTHLDHSGNGNTTGQGEGQGVDLKLTRKKKLGPSLSRKAETKLKRLTARQVLNRTPSDSVVLLEQSTAQESLNGSLTDTQSAEHVNTIPKQGNRGTSSGATVKRGKKGEHNLKSLRGKKKKRLIVDNVCLLRQSDSDSSLSDQVEEVGSGGGENECASGDNGDDSFKETAVEYTEEEEDRTVSNRLVKNKIKSKRKLGRVKVGKKWVKASSNKPQPPVEQDGGVRETGQGDGIGGKRRRPMDEESRRKRIEHRKLRRQRKKVGHL